MIPITITAACLGVKIWQPCKQFKRYLPYAKTFIHYLNDLPETKYAELANGATVVTEERDVGHACIGLYFDAGARYESKYENGIANMFQHIAFKGCKSMSKTAVEEQLSALGARVHCSTSRELVAYTAECLAPAVPSVLHVMCESIFNNLYCDADIQNERKNILSEMAEHETNYSALLDDYLHRTAFQGTPLSQTVMGLSENLEKFDGPTISRYVARFFSPRRLVVVCVGGIKHEHFVSLAEKTVTPVATPACTADRVYRFTGSEVRFRDDTVPKANVAIAFEGPKFGSDDHVVMEVAANLLGGWDRSQGGGMNHACRLARAASEGHLADSYRAFNISYKDTGLWGVQFMGVSLQLDDMLYNIQDELMKICTTVSQGEVERARHETKTKILTMLSTSAGACYEIGRWTLLTGCRPSAAARVRAVDAVSAARLRRACGGALYDRCPAVAAVGPVEGLPEYNRIRASMYWLRL